MKDPHKLPHMTSIRDPWCLVFRGGHQEGCRPNTRMAYLKLAVPGTNGASYMAYLMNHDGGGRTDTLRRVEASDIAKRFRGWHQPDRGSVRKALEAIPPEARSEAS